MTEKRTWGGRRHPVGGRPKAADPTSQVTARVPGWVFRWLDRARGERTLSSFTAEILEDAAKAKGEKPPE